MYKKDTNERYKTYGKRIEKPSSQKVVPDIENPLHNIAYSSKLKAAATPQTHLPDIRYQLKGNNKDNMFIEDDVTREPTFQIFKNNKTPDASKPRSLNKVNRLRMKSLESHSPKKIPSKLDYNQDSFARNKSVLKSIQQSPDILR